MLRSIQAKFLGLTLPLLAVLIALAVASYGYLNYLRACEELQMRLDQFVASSSIILAEPISSGLQDQVSLILASMIADADIESIAIYDQAGAIIDSYGEVSSVDLLYDKKSSITFADEAGVRVVGYLEIKAGNRNLLRGLWGDLFFQAILGGVLVLLAIVVTIFGYRRAVAIPLELLRRAIIQAEPDQDRRIEEWHAPDEIGALFRAYNEMQTKLQDNEAALRALHIELESRVRDRTQALLLAKDEAEAANLAKSNFLAIISHELRTPLTSIKGGLGLLRRLLPDPLPKETAVLVDIAARNSDRLEVLIDDLLDLQKIESGVIPLNPESLLAKALIETAIAENEGVGEHYQTRFTALSVDPEAAVRGDETRIMQIFANLMSNAAKFSPAGSEVELRASNDDGLVRFSVRDRGIGINDAFRDQVFDRFSQQNPANNRPAGGTGLGLNIAKTLVEQMGGNIGYRANEDVGTTFYFDLPEAVDARALKDSPA